jgi:hypothetical protein
MVYVTNNGPRMQIKADRTMVENIVSCFAQADMLHLTLAERTMGYYVEQNQQLTILTPTGFQEKPPFNDDFDTSLAVSLHQ